jgi:NAD(P)-dependent dehydrogenase (short-subunit alcohol dehydrogenase family)
MTTPPSRAVVVGGSSGIGRATAELLAQGGLEVLALGRDPERLAALAAEAGGPAYEGRLITAAADAGDAAALHAALELFGRFDHLVLSPSSGRGMGMFAELDLAALRGGFDGKYWPQIVALQQALPLVSEAGSITFITGGSSGAAFPGTAGLAAINGALEAMVPVLAVELAPRRVNAVSPGVIDTPWWDAVPVATREAYFAQFAAKAPAGRIGHPSDVADAVRFLIGNTFTTGNILKLDGGSRLRP